MDLPTALFKAIDVLFDYDQNRKKCTKFKNVEFEIEKDVVYDNSDAKTCLLDTYVLKNRPLGKTPVFFYIHGGGFVAGDKYRRRAIARWAAVRGYFVVNVNYGLSPEYKFPAPVKHLVSALNWVGDNAERLNLDVNKMVVSGDSAGGYMSVMLASVACNKSLQEKFGVSTDLTFGRAMPICGIYDIETALSKHMPFDLTNKILVDYTGVTLDQLDKYEYLDLFAPFKNVNENFPETFLCYSVKDIFCKGQGEKLLERFAELGVKTIEHHVYKLIENHCYCLSFTTKASKVYWNIADKFLTDYINL